MGSVRKTLRIAWREFSSTALTKGFIIGALLTPVIMVVVLTLITFIVATQREPAVTGTVAIADPTGVVAPHLRDELSSEAYAKRAADRAEGAAEFFAKIDPRVAKLISGAQDSSTLPDITVEVLPPDFDLEAEKQRVREGGSTTDRLALAIIAPNAVDATVPVPEATPVDSSAGEPSADETGTTGEPAQSETAIADGDESGTETETEDAGPPPFGGFELFVRPKMNNAVEGDIRGALVRGIREERFAFAGEDPAHFRRLNDIASAATMELTEGGGERKSLGDFKNFIPYAFMMVMLIPVFVGGQYLMTTTIEEKGSRVVEVLLSAVSPMQLMGGKILGQMCVGLSIMLIYGGLGGGALFVFSLGDLLGWLPLTMMLIFFVLAYFTYAGFMAAIGAAVNELREAQSLMTPVIIPLMIPYALGIFIADDPNSTFARVCSFIPPINPFVMILRVASTEPPPAWEILLSLAIAFATCVLAVYVAAKVFRVGLLMHGKPPNFATLVKWARMA